MYLIYDKYPRIKRSVATNIVPRSFDIFDESKFIMVAKQYIEEILDLLPAFKIELRIIEPDVCVRDSGWHTILGLANCHKFSRYRA